MKKNVYFLQINISEDTKTSYLPYATGSIVAYLKSREALCGEYEFFPPFFFREAPEVLIEKIKNPFLVGISCSMWNSEYNRIAAALIKEKYPDCLIVLGGHNIRTGGKALSSYPNADFLMSGEGEEPYEALLTALMTDGDFEKVPNISFYENGSCKSTVFITDFDVSAYPSPYTSGVFDSTVAEYPDVVFDAVLETNRGCPYACAYCDWCYSKKVRQFPVERVKSDIEWLAKNGFEYVYCADANFGILDRDVEIAAFAVQMKKKYGFPKVFRATYAKQSNENVFAASRLLNEAGLEKGVTISYQTMSETAQKNIGRSNIPMESFRELWQKYNEIGVPTYTELILGLPGETYESFSKGICALLDAGQHNSLSVYICQVYKNSPLADEEYMKKHGIVTVKTPIHSYHARRTHKAIPEYFRAVCATDTMPPQDWQRAYMFSVIVQAFHHLGLLRCFAIYLRYEKNVSYYDFYNALLNFVLSEESGALYDIFNSYFVRLQRLDNDNLTDNDVGSYGWYFEEGAFLKLAAAEELFMELVRPFLQSFDIEADIFNELEKYQYAIIRRMDVTELEVQTEYDFYSYFEYVYSGKIKPLEKRKTTLSFKSKMEFDGIDSYARSVILKGRRRGASVITNSKDEITVK